MLVWDGELSLEGYWVALDFDQLLLGAVCLPKQFAGRGRRAVPGGIKKVALDLSQLLLVAVPA